MSRPSDKSTTGKHDVGTVASGPARSAAKSQAKAKAASQVKSPSASATRATGKPVTSGQNVTGARLGEAVERARSIFTERSLRFTDLREQVFTEIAATTGAIGAYDILGRLAGKGTRLAPVSVYRSIEALLDAGVIHRLETKNAYFACRRHEHAREGRPIFLSCERCGAVTETEAQRVFDLINDVARVEGFEAKIKFVEVSGVCARCAAKTPRAGGK